MAKKLLDQEEAARLLGVSVDELNSMRDRKQVFPTRDGGVWKYKPEEIERLQRDRGGEGSGAWADTLSLDDQSLNISDEIISLDSPDSGDGPSTIIGRGKDASGGASDLRLADLDLAGGSSKAGSSKGGFDVGDLEGSNVIGSGGKSTSPAKGGSGLLDDFDLAIGSSDKLMGSGSLKLADEDLQLADPSKLKKSPGSDTRKGKSEVQLGDEDDELVLGAKPDSDITTGGADSGISLVDANDSGLSLEEPLELESSGAESLDLGEEDLITLEPDADADLAAQLRPDDDFLLTPVDDADDDADSGSQVIALEADEEFSSGQVLPSASAGMLEEDLSAAGLQSPFATAGAPTPAYIPGYSTDVPYSTWNVVSLIVVSLFLIVGGMMMYDLVRQMWMWDKPFAVNSSIMNSLGNTIGWFEK